MLFILFIDKLLNSNKKAILLIVLIIWKLIRRFKLFRQGAKVLKMIFANHHGNSTNDIYLESSFYTKLESGSGKNRFLVISGYVSMKCS